MSELNNLYGSEFPVVVVRKENESACSGIPVFKEIFYYILLSIELINKSYIKIVPKYVYRNNITTSQLISLTYQIILVQH